MFEEVMEAYSHPDRNEFYFLIRSGKVFKVVRQYGYKDGNREKVYEERPFVSFSVEKSREYLMDHCPRSFSAINPNKV